MKYNVIVNYFRGFRGLLVLEPFFFAEQILTVMTYRHMLQLYLLPQMEDQPGVVFQQDGAPPYWPRIDMHFPGRWVRRDGPIP
jgi:hypothetical protein